MNETQEGNVAFGIADQGRINTFRNGCTKLALILTLLTLTSCSPKAQKAAMMLPGFSISNEPAGGTFRQVLHATNGLALYFSDTNIVVWFCSGSSIVVHFDPHTLTPQGVLLEIPRTKEHPAEHVLDFNADGVPDIRRVNGSAQTEIFYEGKWYPKLQKGTNTAIMLDHNVETKVRFDGQSWIPISDL